MAALMEKMGLSYRGCARILAKREDLRVVLRIKHLPSHNAIWKSRNLMNNLVTQSPPNQPEVVTGKESESAEVVTEKYEVFQSPAAA